MKELRNIVVWTGTLASLLLVGVYAAGPLAEYLGWPTPLSRTMIPVLVMLTIGPFGWLLSIPASVMCWWNGSRIWSRAALCLANLAGSGLSVACAITAYKFTKMGPINPG